MALPRIFLAAPLLLAGVFLPAAGSAPAKAPEGVLGMVHEEFSDDTVTVHCGQTLTMVNNSRFVHIIGAGEDGLVKDAVNVPVAGRVLMETDDVYTTTRWNTAGTFYLTCSVHPEMTVKVVVTACT